MLAALLVSVGTVEFIFSAASLVSNSVLILFGLELTTAQQERIAPVVGGGLAYAFLALAAWWAASIAARATSGGHAALGATVGFLGAAGAQLLLARFPTFPTVDLWEAMGYGIVGTLGGAAGGLRGRDRRARGESRARMTGAISHAASPQATIRAVGEHLEAFGAGAVVAWQADARSRWASWYRTGWEEHAGDVSPPENLAANRARNEPLILRGPRGGTSHEAAPWLLHPRARMVLLAELRSPTDERVGVLAVGFARGHVRAAMVREFVVAVDQASVALDRMRLEVEARQAGEKGERERVARDIHDGPLGRVQGSSILLDEALRLLDGQKEQDPSPGSRRSTLVRLLEKVYDHTHEAATELRGAVNALAPKPVEQGGLAHALRSEVERFASDTGAEAALSVDEGDLSLDSTSQSEIFRVAQEALNNVRKHARASRVELRLYRVGNAVVLHVGDDGVGFAADSRNAGGDGTTRDGGFGLGSMRGRVEALGGKLLVESTLGEGTKVNALFQTRVDAP